MVQQGIYREGERKGRKQEGSKANVGNDLNVIFVDVKLFKIKGYGDKLIQETY